VRTILSHRARGLDAANRAVDALRIREERRPERELADVADDRRCDVFVPLVAPRGLHSGLAEARLVEGELILGGALILGAVLVAEWGSIRTVSPRRRAARKPTN
jgi:hypothetical protein